MSNPPSVADASAAPSSVAASSSSSSSLSAVQVLGVKRKKPSSSEVTREQLPRKPDPAILYVPTAKSRHGGSRAWLAFRKLNNISNWVYCLGCLDYLKFHSSTKSMLNHIKSCSGAQKLAPEKDPAAQALESVDIGKMLRRAGQVDQQIQPRLTPANKKKVDTLLTAAVVSGNLPFRMTDNEDVKALFLALGYEVPCGKTVSKCVDKVFDEQQLLLYDSMKRASSISLTTDSATSAAGTSYEAVTGHWLNEEWEPQSATLGLQPLQGSHTGTYIAGVVKSTVGRFPLLEDKTFGLSTGL